MYSKPLLLEEPFAQTLSGKNKSSQISREPSKYTLVQSHGEPHPQTELLAKTSGQQATKDLGGSIAPKNGALNDALL